ncbi:hypothetical protein SEA_MORGANA_69 [Gordonia phage Morgana]|uniref:Uncharacterized protein n=1 Tax=Gordonia phage Morgana TaxID=3137292 RepID=A0AAX4RAQ5_9CAUD
MSDTPLTIDGWARMFGRQKKFHYFRETEPGQSRVRSMCGKYEITPGHISFLGPLQPYRPGALHIAPGDCLECSRKLRANETGER